MRLDDVEGISPSQGVQNSLAADVVVRDGKGGHERVHVTVSHVHHNVYVSSETYFPIGNSGKAADDHVGDIQSLQDGNYVGEKILQFMWAYWLKHHRASRCRECVSIHAWIILLEITQGAIGVRSSRPP
jgi:hypothetical protein